MMLRVHPNKLSDSCVATNLALTLSSQGSHTNAESIHCHVLACYGTSLSTWRYERLHAHYVCGSTSTSRMPWSQSGVHVRARACIVDYGLFVCFSFWYNKILYTRNGGILATHNHHAYTKGDLKTCLGRASLPHNRSSTCDQVHLAASGWGCRSVHTELVQQKLTDGQLNRVAPSAAWCRTHPRANARCMCVN
jgi:hypothetical protein